MPERPKDPYTDPTVVHRFCGETLKKTILLMLEPFDLNIEEVKAGAKVRQMSAPEATAIATLCSRYEESVGSKAATKSEVLVSQGEVTPALARKLAAELFKSEILDAEFASATPEDGDTPVPTH
jgi:hypothetical protein